MTTDNDFLGFDGPPNLEPENPEEDNVIVDENKQDDTEQQVSEAEQELVTLALDPKDISGSLDRLMRENPDVLNVVNSLIGNKARTKYNPRIQELETELEALRAKESRDKFSTIPETELADRMKDPQFAREYSDAMSSEEVIAQKRYQAQVSRRISNVIDTAQDAGLSIAGANSIMDRLRNGEFDTDENGQPIQDLDTALSNLNRAVYSEMLKQGVTPAGSGVNEAGSSDGNDNRNTNAQVADALDESNPDVSGGNAGSGGSRGPRFSIDEINKMDPLEFERVFPNDDDYERAVREGRITGLSQSAREVYA